MASEAEDELFWQEIPSSNTDVDDGDIQRMTLGHLVQQQEEGHVQQHVQVQLTGRVHSPSMELPGDENVNNNNRISSPSTSSGDMSQETILLPGMVNPDAIIPQSRSYTCRICQVTFPNKSAVTVHSRIHTNHEGKPYRCGFCGKGFSTNFYLKQHERIHNGQKPYKCPMCEHSFKQLSHVQQHVRTHTGVRPYKCHWPGCGKAFLQQSHLKSHVARHTPKPNNGIRPYKCQWPECGKSFAQLSNLKSHMARHAPKSQKGRKGSVAGKKETPEAIDLKREMEESNDGGSFSLVSVSPDVIGQAAAAANIVPVLDYESICPFLCPGCSKLYVREATFKKHLEECKTKLQMSISATAAALGIEPPPLPPPNAQLPNFPPDAVTLPNLNLHTDSELNLDLKKNGKRSRKTQKSPMQHLSQQQQAQIIVEMPLVDMPLSDVSLADVKQEILNIPMEINCSTDNSMFKIPQILNPVAENSSTHSASSSGGSLYSSIPYYQLQNTSALSGAALFTTSQTTAAGDAVVLTTSAQQPESKVGVAGKLQANSPGHSTINQAALRWQWDQPSTKINYQ